MLVLEQVSQFRSGQAYRKGMLYDPGQDQKQKRTKDCWKSHHKRAKNGWENEQNGSKTTRPAQQSRKRRRPSRLGRPDGTHKRNRDEHRTTGIKSRDLQTQSSFSYTRIYRKQRAPCSCNSGQVERGSG